MKIFKNITAVVIFLFVAIVGGFSVFSAVRNGNFPECDYISAMNGELSGTLEKYISENLVFRDIWRSASARLESEICESIVNNVYVSDNMLLNAEISEKGFIHENSEYINSFASDYDGAVYFTAVPTSSGIYSEILPEYLVNTTEKQQIDDFYEMLGGNIRKIDSYNILKTFKENYIYYRSDNRWTSYGAFCVYRTVIQKLGFLPSAYDKYTIEHVTDSYRGNLFSRVGYMKSKADILDIYTYSNGTDILECKGFYENGKGHECKLYDKSALYTENMYDIYMNGNYPLVKIKTSLNNERKLLVIKDSFGDCFIPFLIQHYNEIAVVSPEYMQCGISELIDKDDYEQTLFLFGIDSIKNGIFSELIVR